MNTPTAPAQIRSVLPQRRTRIKMCGFTREQDVDAAVAAADPTDRIVVFGSFYTVGGVLGNGTPRLSAKHLLP